MEIRGRCLKGRGRRVGVEYPVRVGRENKTELSEWGLKLRICMKKMFKTEKVRKKKEKRNENERNLKKKDMEYVARKRKNKNKMEGNKMKEKRNTKKRKNLR